MSRKNSKKNLTVENLDSDSTISTLDSIFDSINPGYGSLLSNDDYLTTSDWISTGSYTLNALISSSLFKGIPSGKVTVFSGESASGKTLLALNTCREAIKKGYMVLWCDTENAIEKEQVKSLGIDPKMFRHQRFSTNTIEELTTYLVNVFAKLKELKNSKKSSENKKIMIVIDSIGQLPSQKEMLDSLSGSDKVDMTRAKMLKRLFRVITSDIAYLDIPVLMINHIYANVGSFIGGNVQSGGSGPMFSASIIVEFSKAQLKMDEDSSKRTGTIVTAKLIKGRFSTVGAKKKIHISFKNGVNPYIGLQSFMNPEFYERTGIGFGKIDKSDGSFIQTTNKDDITKQGYVINGNSVKYNNFFLHSVFNDDVLKVLDEYAQDELKFKNDNYSNDDIENDIDNETNVEEITEE